MPNGIPVPAEERTEYYVLAGKIISANWFYLKICTGVSYFYQIKRGAEIPTGPPNHHEKLISTGIGFPIEILMGLIKKVGIGLKIKLLAGQDFHLSILFELPLKASLNQ